MSISVDPGQPAKPRPRPNCYALYLVRTKGEFVLWTSKTGNGINNWSIWDNHWWKSETQKSHTVPWQRSMSHHKSGKVIKVTDAFPIRAWRESKGLYLCFVNREHKSFHLKKIEVAGQRNQYLWHAKRALYYLS